MTALPQQLTIESLIPITARTILFHVMDGGSNLVGWDLSPVPIPSLISMAAYLNKKNRLQAEWARPVIAAKCEPLILDSGRLTWMKKGLGDWARKDLTPLLLETAANIGADVIVAGDVPMEPNMLANVDLKPNEALRITWAANESLQAADTRAVRGYVIQGFEEAQYRKSIEVAMASPQLDDVIAGRAVWIIGSVCMAPIPKVRQIARLVRDLLPGPIHMLGQGRPEVIRELREMGVRWADSGTAAGYAARAKWLYPTRDGTIAWRRLHDGRRLPPEAYGLLVRNNMEVMEMLLQETW